MSDLTKEQLAIRRTGLGASEVSAILGLPSFRSPLDIWQSKVEEVETPDSPDLWRGRAIEPVILKWYERETGCAVKPSPAVRHPRCQVLFATPDAMRDQPDPFTVEAKSVRYAMRDLYGEPGTDQVPQQYVVQVQVQLACTGAQVGELAALFGVDELRVFRFARDVELESLIIEQCERWWRDYVVAGKPPPVDGSEAWAERLAARSRPVKSIPATEQLRNLAESLRRAKQGAKDAAKMEAEARAALLDLMGDAESVEGLVTYREAKGRAVTDWKGLCAGANVPTTLVEKFTTRSPYRTLRLLGSKSDE